MDSLNYDNYHKFLISIGLFLISLPVLAFVFLCSDTFNLMISEEELSTYTEVAQLIIAKKQSMPLLLNSPLAGIIAVGVVIYGSVLLHKGCRGLKRWQSREEEIQELNREKTRKEVEKLVTAMKPKQVMDEAIFDFNTTDSEQSFDGRMEHVMMSMLIEERFYQYIKTQKKNYVVKHNVKIKNVGYDLITFATERFKKDCIYEIKFITHNIPIEEIERALNKMSEQKRVFEEQFNHSPSAELVLVVDDGLYEKIKSRTNQVKPRNNYHIRVMKQNDLEII